MLERLAAIKIMEDAWEGIPDVVTECFWQVLAWDNRSNYLRVVKMVVDRVPDLTIYIQITESESVSRALLRQDKDNAPYTGTLTYSESEQVQRTKKVQWLSKHIPNFVVVDGMRPLEQVWDNTKDIIKERCA